MLTTSTRLLNRVVYTTVFALIGFLGSSSDANAAVGGSVTVQGQYQRTGTSPNYDYSVKGTGAIDVPDGATWTITVKIDRVVSGGPNVNRYTANFGGSGDQSYGTGFQVMWAGGTAPTTGSEDYLITVTGSYTKDGVTKSFAPQTTTVTIDYP